MILRNWIIALTTVLFVTSAHAKTPMPLFGDASGGDCALNHLVYNKVYDPSFPRKSLFKAIPFINDLCDFDEHIRMVIDGKEQRLLHVSGDIKENVTGSKVFYSNDQYSVKIDIGDSIVSFSDEETECKETWYYVHTTILHAGHKWMVNGTLTGACP